MNNFIVFTFHLLFLNFLFFIQSSPAQSIPLQRYTYEEPQMGTTFKIIIYSKNKTESDLAVKKAFQKIAELNHIMSDYLEQSEVSQLSKNSGTKKKTRVSKDLYHIIKTSKKWSKKTKGSFDISIGPLSKLWRRAFRQKVVPDSSAIAEALSKVNYRWIKLHIFSKRISLKNENMRLDLGGIAKGYAVDEAMAILKKAGIKSALIDGGGDILVSNAPPGQGGWLIKTPFAEKGLILENMAIATSGNTYQFLEWNGKKYGHLINPITGFGMQSNRMLTIIAESCVTADVLATACSILSEKEIEKLQQKQKFNIVLH